MSRTAISFASRDFYKSQERLAGELTGTGFFKRVISYKQTDLNGTDFLAKHRQFIVKNRRGFGCWIWKPYIIGRALASLEEGEYLYYSDAGCTFETGGQPYMEDFISRVESSQQPVHVVTCSEFTIGQLCKADVLDERYANCREVEANRIIIRKCAESVDFIEKWIALASDYHNIDDSPSVRAAERAEFIEHRHDQSLFSILWYRAGYAVMPDSGYVGSHFWRATRIRDGDGC
jgi:hypothetical protein